MVADLIALQEEQIDFSKPITLFDPVHTWKKKTFQDYTVEELLKPIFIGGKLVYEVPTIEQSRTYCAQQIEKLWDEVLRFENPQEYYVDLSLKLWNMKQSLLQDSGKC